MKVYHLVVRSKELGYCTHEGVFLKKPEQSELEAAKAYGSIEFGEKELYASESHEKARTTFNDVSDYEQLRALSDQAVPVKAGDTIHMQWKKGYQPGGPSYYPAPGYTRGFPAGQPYATQPAQHANFVSKEVMLHADITEVISEIRMELAKQKVNGLSGVSIALINRLKR